MLGGKRGELEREGDGMYLPHVCACLTDLGEELDTCHPFFETEACFTREVVEVGDEALHDVFEAWVGAL